MTWDTDALIRVMQEAERTLSICETQIHKLQGRVAELEEENQRLRDRLAKFGERMRRMEEGEL